MLLQRDELPDGARLYSLFVGNKETKLTISDRKGKSSQVYHKNKQSIVAGKHRFAKSDGSNVQGLVTFRIVRLNSLCHVSMDIDTGLTVYTESRHLNEGYTWHIGPFYPI